MANYNFGEIEQLLQNQQHREAFLKLRPILIDPEILADVVQWRTALGLFTQVAAVYSGEKLVEKVNAVLNDPKKPQYLFDLGRELIKVGLSDIAAALLSRANQLYPQQRSLVRELVAALERDHGRYAEATQVLLASPELIASDFICQYLLAFNGLMSGDLSHARRLRPILLENAGDEARRQFMAGTIDAMLGRAEAVQAVTPLDLEDLRGWHFVVSGGLLLHLSSAGPEVMHGRYAFVQDNVALEFDAIERLKLVLATWQTNLPRVFSLPDRNSAALSEATGQLLGLPVTEWGAAGSTEPGLIVAYNLRELPGEVLATFAEHRLGQVLWSHAESWTDTVPFASDLTTYLYQSNHSPWEAGALKIDPVTKQAYRAEAVEGSPKELAQRIINATLRERNLEDASILQNFAAAVTQAGEKAGAFRHSGRRGRQWPGSPVPSNRF